MTKLALAGFKKWRELCIGCSKKNCSPEKNQAVLETGKIGPGRFSKALGAASVDLLPNSSEGFELNGFESFQQIQKLLALHG